MTQCPLIDFAAAFEEVLCVFDVCVAPITHTRAHAPFVGSPIRCKTVVNESPHENTDLGKDPPPHRAFHCFLQSSVVPIIPHLRFSLAWWCRMLLHLFGWPIFYWGISILCCGSSTPTSIPYKWAVPFPAPFHSLSTLERIFSIPCPQSLRTS